MDLTGGYYDAGDNVKFNLPMAYTTTMLSWNALEHGKRMGGQLPKVREAIRWATDYLLKCARAEPGKLFVGVGDPNADHKCWERPEDMDTVRSVYFVSSSNPGSDVAAETAAALASASMVFRKVDPVYSRLLLSTAKNVFNFAVRYKGSYSDSLGSAVCPFYCSYSGYQVCVTTACNIHYIHILWVCYIDFNTLNFKVCGEERKFEHTSFANEGGNSLATRLSTSPWLFST